MLQLSETDLQELESLLVTQSPSSAEEEIAGYVERFNDACACRRDALGNIFLSLPGSEGPSVMIAAHADEIGLQLIHVTPEGYVRFRAVGGVDVKATAGRQVHILSAGGKVPGVICKVPVHIEYKEKSEKPLEMSDLWIDIGCSSAQEALSRVSVGDMIAFAPNALRLGNHRLSSKALDNKLGVFVAASAMRRLAAAGSDRAATAVFTVQEEVGCKGAAVAAEALKPVWGICIDVGVATDCPGVSAEKYGPLALGAGPGLSFCTDTSRSLTEQACLILEQKGIPFQKTVGLSATGGTDTLRMQMAGQGIPCILMSVPLRSMHTPSEICDMNDVAACIDAMVALVENIQV